MEAPNWLKSFMLGDVCDEGVIFSLNLDGNTYDTIRRTMTKYIEDETIIDALLCEYDITSALSPEALVERVCYLGGDVAFKIPDFQAAIAEKALFKYHFDQTSRLKNPLEGAAYHAHELLYLYGNSNNELSENELTMARGFASAWIKFTYGESPWISGEGIWKIWGPNSQQRTSERGGG
ncbi:unnamed protein product [Penicillium palitans]